MCGFIAVLQDAPVFDVAEARCALNAMAHRGPDASGEWQEANVLLLHRRLSIIDLSTGQQPMHSHDGRYVVVFNGEVYNFRELRGLLEDKGAIFRTQSDTEILLEGYRQWGPAVVKRLNGMFAFVIWDRMESTAFAARDRLGIKPLSWAVRRDALFISSTLEPFNSVSGFRNIDLAAVRDLMTFDYIPSSRSILQGVQKLEPGCRFHWSFGAGEPTVDRYWSPPLADKEARAPDEFELEDLLDQAVKRQMISDVPIGVFLSGGIDSSLVTAFMARHSAKPVRSFSIGFREKDVDESPIAGLVARQFGTDHTVLPEDDVVPESLLELFGRLDEPFGDPAVVPTYVLSRMTAAHVKVALSGDGGDEVFGGYPKYLAGDAHHDGLPLQRLFHHFLRLMPWKPRGMSRVYWRTLSSRDLIRWGWVRYGDFPVFRKDIRQLFRACYHEQAEVDQYFTSWERRARRYGNSMNIDVLMRTDLETYLSENCLVKTDRATMLASLEVRVPLLDNVVLDRILPLEANNKIVNRRLKALLLPIAKRLLPKEVWDRPKHGFHVPTSRFMSTLWRPAIETALDWGETNMGLFDYGYLRRLHKRNLSDGGIGRELWTPFAFLAWAMAHRLKI